MKAVVVGGGLAGSLLAVYLARRGHAVDVFERHSDARSGHGVKRASVNITLCERGLQALAKLGLRDGVIARAAPVYGRTIHAIDGATTYQPYGHRGELIYSIARSELNDILVDFADRQPGVHFHFDQKCTHVDLARASAKFDGTRSGVPSDVQADLLFGADGAYSIVRGHFQRRDLFNYSQQYWHQGYTTMRIPPRAEGTPVLESGSLHIWPRGEWMLIGFPNLDGAVSCSLLMPFRGRDSYESTTTDIALISLFRRLFPDAVELIPQLSQQFFSTPRNSLLTVRCDPWSFADKSLLLGDAAHAILPSYGQGANAAFEDCAILDECATDHPLDWRAAFLDFERRRKPNMDAIATLCVEHFAELSKLVGDPAFLKRREIERQIHDLYPALYQPLYSMVTFSDTPYLDAIQIDRDLRTLVDRIMEAPEPAAEIKGHDFRNLLEGAVHRTR
ncbi:MAG: NAD(P)/FAD-dependent oxidoreductase [Polyangiaceae bacterium]|jgi:kynurenine 3-monooxygenase